MRRRLVYLRPFFCALAILLLTQLQYCCAQELPADWPVPTRRGAQVLIVPPAKWLDKPAANADQTEWQALAEKRKARAEELVASAKEDLAAGAGALAYQKLYAALRENPDDAALRKVLGYYLSPRQVWQTSSAVPVAKAATAAHPKFGWKPRAYWRLDTPHYRLTSSHSASGVVEVGNHLENFHLLWRQLFFDYWSSPETLAARLGGEKDPLENKLKKLEVILFRDREEYVTLLTPGEPKIGLTTGLYVGKQKISYFYLGDGKARTSWDHEAAHQLFQEYDSLTDQPGEERNFWVVEGAAMYLESLAKHAHVGGDYWSVGGAESARLQIARYRVLTGDFYMPLEKLTSLSREELQSEADIRKIYSQSAGLFHFFMDGNDGKYRPALMKYLRAVYEKQDRAETLSKLMGKSFAELDQEYKAYLADVTDADIAAIPSPARVQELSLGATSVTKKALPSLAAFESLTWLDLTGCPLSDEAFADFAKEATCKKLARLFLERTKLTDDSLASLKTFTGLEELDLSRLEITDEGLAHLKGHKKLTALYLTGTSITDAGLQQLRGLSALETLEVSGTKVTKTGLAQLQSKLPQLKNVSGGQ